MPPKNECYEAEGYARSFKFVRNVGHQVRVAREMRRTSVTSESQQLDDPAPSPRFLWITDQQFMMERTVVAIGEAGAAEGVDGEVKWLCRHLSSS